MAQDRVSQMQKVHDEAIDLFSRKNRDYGDAFANYGTVGVLVRMGDKIMRLQSISKNGIQLVNDERLRDTLIDLHNYAGMAVMLLDEEQNVDGSDGPVLESNKEETVSWGIYGDSGNIYQRAQTRVNGIVIKETCSCPAFKYSKNNTCKHITGTYNYIKLD